MSAFPNPDLPCHISKVIDLFLAIQTYAFTFFYQGNLHISTLVTRTLSLNTYTATKQTSIAEANSHTSSKAMCLTADYRLACGHWNDPERMLRTLWLDGCVGGKIHGTKNPDKKRKCDVCVAKEQAVADRKAYVMAREQEKNVEEGEVDRGGRCVLM